MKKLTKVLSITVLAVSIFASSVANAAGVSFKDVKKSDWYYSAVNWGTGNGMVSGYPDGTFKPNNKVTEAEFLKLLIASYTKVDTNGSYGNWYDPYYAFALEKNFAFTGLATSPINRTQVAEIVTGAAGKNYSGNDAIIYLLGNGLAKGKVSGDVSVAGYKGSDLLTRAEAVQFIKNAKENGLDSLKNRPTSPSNPADLPKLPEPPKPVPTGNGTLDSLIKNMQQIDTSYQFKAGETSASFMGDNGKAVISATTNGNKVNSVILWDNTSSTNVELAIEVLKAAGVSKVDEAGLAKAIKDGYNTAQEKTFNFGGKEIQVSPSNKKPEITFIHILN